MQRKQNFYLDNPDIQFHLVKRLDFEALFSGLAADEREALGVESVEEFRAQAMSVLEALGEICGTDLAQNAFQVEKEPMLLKDGVVTLPGTRSEEHTSELQSH